MSSCHAWVMVLCLRSYNRTIPNTITERYSSWDSSGLSPGTGDEKVLPQMGIDPRLPTFKANKLTRFGGKRVM